MVGKKSSTFWIIASTVLSTIIAIESLIRDLKDTHRHVRAKWSGGGEAVECGRWSEKSSLFWIIVSVSLFITTIESDSRAGEWQDCFRLVPGGGSSVCYQPRAKWSAFFEMDKRISATGEGGRWGACVGQSSSQLVSESSWERGGSLPPKTSSKIAQVTSPSSRHPSRHPTRHQSYDSVKWTLPSFFFAMVTL